MKTLAEQNMKQPQPLADHHHHHHHQQDSIKLISAKKMAAAEAKTATNRAHAHANNNNNKENGFRSAAPPAGDELQPAVKVKQQPTEATNKTTDKKTAATTTTRPTTATTTTTVKQTTQTTTKASQPDSAAAAAAATSPPKQAAPANANANANANEIGLLKRCALDCLLLAIKGLILVYDLISQPVFYFRHSVARRRAQVEAPRSLQLDPRDPESPWRQVDIEPLQVELERRIDSFDTYDQMMAHSFRANARDLCYGYRQVLAETHTRRAADSDKLLRQVRLSAYRWVTFGDFERQIEAARRGLLLDGVRAGHRVMLYADTRPEWQIVSQALIRLGAVVGTMYSTLGVDGIVHTVNETEVSHVITQRDKVLRLLKLREKLPKLRRIIYFERSLHLPGKLQPTTTTRPLKGDGQVDERGERSALAPVEPSDHEAEQEEAAAAAQKSRLEQLRKDKLEFGQYQRLLAERSADLQVECKCFTELLEEALAHEEAEAEAKQADGSTYGKLAELERENGRLLRAQRRNKDSLAVIMYTSGSTGIPKGVLISHGNIMATIKSFSYVTKDFVHAPKANTCTAYLPLAHIFEFCIESVMLYHGVKYGFATPHTLTDKSPGLMAGQRGDLALLRPTVMIIVPLILDRVVQGVKQALKAGPYFKEQLVTYLINYKSYWQQRHYETPLVDRLVCGKIAAALGGRARWVICGSAPLSSQTQTFVRAALNLKLPQGFGTTETCAATACQLFDDQSTQNVGLPVAGAQIKLEPWLEGNYRPTDRPNPRGEIVVGGEMIAQGYFNLEQQTREAFYVDAQGTRWYRTGDIGEFLPNGQLKIIDRKKDLVKLQNGEYISLGRVESTLKSNPYTENFCVYASSAHNYVVALGPANELGLRTLAQRLVDEHERRNSPSLVRRLQQQQQNGSPAGVDHNQNDPQVEDQHVGAAGTHERDRLLGSMSDDERQAAIDELRQLLAEYEAQDESTSASSEQQQQQHAGAARKMSSLSTSSAGGGSPGALNERLGRLCANRLVNESVLEHVRNMARERHLLSLEIPRKLLLLAEEWTEDKNLVTAAMKIRRNFVYKRYERELEQLYAADC